MQNTPQHDGTTPHELAQGHAPHAIRQRLRSGSTSSYLKDFVYGAIDGAVTTFAVVAGVAGAGLSSQVVVILGIANLIGDGFSMAAGNFLGSRAEFQRRERLRRMEERHIERVPEGEREEVRQIYAAHGFEGRELEQVVEVITSDRDRWINVMLKEEHGLSADSPNPWKAAGTTFGAFLLIGAIPLLPFLGMLVLRINVPSPYVWSTAMTGVAFFTVGAVKARFVDQSWPWAGLETLSVGSIAAALAYAFGALVAWLI